MQWHSESPRHDPMKGIAFGRAGRNIGSLNTIHGAAVSPTHRSVRQDPTFTGQADQPLSNRGVAGQRQGIIELKGVEAGERVVTTATRRQPGKVRIDQPAAASRQAMHEVESSDFKKVQMAVLCS